jgi:uncharacterized protein
MPTIASTIVTTGVDRPMHPELDTILLKVASRCNLDCTYCYVYHMGDNNWAKQEKLMSEATMRAVCESLQRLRLYQQRIFSVVLHGGEPLLLGSKGLKQLLGTLRRVLPDSYPISLQTNGTLITEEILDICSAFRVSVAVSIDGPEVVHNGSRVTRRGEGSFEQVRRGICLLKAHHDAVFLNAGLLAVIDPESDPREVYSFFKELEAPSLDFLYKDGNHDRLPVGKSAPDSVEYGRWMAGLLDVYLADPDPLPIRVLDDMMKVLLGGMVSKEGLGLTDFGILIIDTDGTIMKNDTLKSSFPGADRFDQSVNIRDGDLIEFLHSRVFGEYRQLQRPSCAACQTCPELNLCGGGMILHRWRKANGFDNPSVYCTDQLYLIGQMRHQLTNYCLPHV